MNIFFLFYFVCALFFFFLHFFWFLYYVCIFVSLFLFCIVFVNKTNRVALVVFFFAVGIPNKRESICICLNLAIQCKLSHTVIIVRKSKLVQNENKNKKKKFQCSYNDLDGNQLFMYSCRSSITLIGAFLCNLNSLLCTMSWMGRHYESDYTKSKTIATLWCKILHACLYENAKQPTRLHDFLSFFLLIFETIVIEFSL